MRFIVNENVARSVIAALRAAGHDVLSVKESMRGESDNAVLARAQADQRIVVTHDKDFGELAFGANLPATSGVILFRLQGKDRDRDLQRVLEVLLSDRQWAGWFSVVDEVRTRMRALPTQPAEE